MDFTFWLPRLRVHPTSYAFPVYSPAATHTRLLVSIQIHCCTSSLVLCLKCIPGAYLGTLSFFKSLCRCSAPPCAASFTHSASCVLFSSPTPEHRAWLHDVNHVSCAQETPLPLPCFHARGPATLSQTWWALTMLDAWRVS